MTDDEIPSWGSIEEGLEKLECLLAQKATPEEVQKALEDIPLANSQFIRPKCKPPGSVFRARRPGLGEDLNLVSTFSLPPIEHTPTGRANLARHPVFYASLLTDTALQETLPENVELEKDGVVYVGEWQLETPFNLKQFLHPAHALKNEVMGDYHYGMMQSLREILKEYSSKNQITLERLAGRIGDYFLRSKDDFLVSSRLGHQALYEFAPPGGFQVDAISYPSRVKDHAAINFAFGPQYATKHLQLVEVRKYQVTSALMDGSHVKLLSVALPDGARLKWFTPELDMNTLRLTSMHIDAKPGENLAFGSRLIRINGHEVDFDVLLKEGWTRQNKALIQKAIEELIPHRMDETPRSVMVGLLIDKVPIDYEGTPLEALQLRYQLECRWILHPHSAEAAA